MSAKIFIDGAVGTTGLEIRERLTGRAEFTLITLDEAQRKDDAARAGALNDADVVILCLPDDAARAAVAMIENPATRVIDASTAHRTAPGWVYGFPELEAEQTAKIAQAVRVSNPGCYPTGFLALVRPLVRAGILPATYPLSVNAISGYSGGGKGMIAEFEKADQPGYSETVARAYALSLAHKHAPEMQLHAGLAHPPVFAPMVGRFYRGMLVEVPLALWSLPSKPLVADLRAVLEESYRGQDLVTVADAIETNGLKGLDAESLKDSNGLKLIVCGNDHTQQARLIALLDNLGKGASGAAVQNLNIMLGLSPSAGLV